MRLEPETCLMICDAASLANVSELSEGDGTVLFLLGDVNLMADLKSLYLTLKQFVE